MISVLMIIVPIIADVFKNLKKKKLNISSLLNVVCILAIFIISIYRFGFHHKPLLFASKGINEQQVEMSRFLHQFYKGKKVVANDIGAVEIELPLEKINEKIILLLNQMER